MENEKCKIKSASEQELSLYCFVGEALCAIQHIEDAISHSIVLKINAPQTKPEADQLLEKHRSYTLGKAMKICEGASLYDEVLQQELNKFLSERNWLVHRSIAHSRDEWDANVSREKLFGRLKAITTHAQRLLQLIEKDLIEFSEAKGKGMSSVKAYIDKHYVE
ncbi:hypothetical protein MIB92_18095 [Aestuariirhabdus sp. Z084]|uniref:hypothetical protein n=1 Tax=Aestuariirhabdus haliotis TaxID=2918751 RepID=UPI00201B3E3C|nr:hypothetical protein [Aestuariirhabdus haliotis]MCL6417577.1 hypothetical protein [Aestuariirhabdus haliotis]MCL6421519.1 hypothetical protein [Aestuariirhabdus haliotis]